MKKNVKRGKPCGLCGNHNEEDAMLITKALMKIFDGFEDWTTEGSATSIEPIEISPYLK